MYATIFAAKWSSNGRLLVVRVHFKFHPQKFISPIPNRHGKSQTHERTLNLTCHDFANDEKLKNSLFKGVLPL